MSAVRKITIGEADAGLRLDRWFRREFPALTHGRLEKLLRKGEIRLDGRRAKGAARLQAGQVVRVPPLGDAGGSAPGKKAAPAKVSEEDAAALRAAVLHRDDCLIALDKPAGLAVQGGSGQRRHLDAMLDTLRFDAEEAPRLVHRLDKDTSGVLLLGRSRLAAKALTEAFRDRTARKIYWALVAGTPPKARGRIAKALAKGHAGGREKVVAGLPEGREAVTLYQVVQRSDRKAAWLALMPLTGRTHQLRAHCALLGAPILGDGKYGGQGAYLEKPALPRRLMLHAQELAILHPEDGTTLRVAAPLPEDMDEAFSLLGFDRERGEEANDSLRAYLDNFRAETRNSAD